METTESRAQVPFAGTAPLFFSRYHCVCAPWREEGVFVTAAVFPTCLKYVRSLSRNTESNDDDLQYSVKLFRAAVRSTRNHHTRNGNAFVACGTHAGVATPYFPGYAESPVRFGFDSGAGVLQLATASREWYA